MIHAENVVEKFDPQPSGTTFSTVLGTLIIVGMDVRAKVCDSGLNTDRIIRLFLPAEPLLRTFVYYLIAVCSRLETASDTTSSSFMRLTALISL